MNDMVTFEKTGFGKIRAILIDGEAWLVGKDVADILEYQNGSRDINRHVDEEDRDEIPIWDSIGRMQRTPFINESVRYKINPREQTDIIKSIFSAVYGGL